MNSANEDNAALHRQHACVALPKHVVADLSSTKAIFLSPFIACVSNRDGIVLRRGVTTLYMYIDQMQSTYNW